MIRIQYRSLAAFAALGALLLLAGCGKQVLSGGKGPDGGSNGQSGRIPPIALFVPLGEVCSLPVAQDEAVKLARQLAPARQGLSSWRDMDFAVSQSLAYAGGKNPATAAITRPGLTVTWGQMAQSLTLLRSLLPQLDGDPALLARHFRWLRLGPDFSFTGYYEPTLKASRTPTRHLSYALYRMPPDLRSGVPYHSRNAIDRRGALRGKGLEIAYVDETDAFFLHVQGSGRLQFPDGSVTHVLYAGKNNQKYVSLGRVMKERGLLPEDGVNMRAIREYLAAHPGERAELFDENPSYVFFREASAGPIGSMGRPLTPWVSLAVDRNTVPQGALTMILAPLPGPDGQHTRPFPALTLPQDAGGAIKGYRMDLFCGAGDEAAHVAGHLDTKGAVYLLLPK